jgi:hypothetical protein
MGLQGAHHRAILTAPCDGCSLADICAAGLACEQFANFVEGPPSVWQNASKVATRRLFLQHVDDSPQRGPALSRDAKRRVRYRANPRRTIERDNEWRRRNRERSNELERAWYERNHERINVRRRERTRLAREALSVNQPRPADGAPAALNPSPSTGADDAGMHRRCAVLSTRALTHNPAGRQGGSAPETLS